MIFHSEEGQIRLALCFGYQYHGYADESENWGPQKSRLIITPGLQLLGGGCRDNDKGDSNIEHLLYLPFQVINAKYQF